MRARSVSSGDFKGVAPCLVLQRRFSSLTSHTAPPQLGAPSLAVAGGDPTTNDLNDVVAVGAPQTSTMCWRQTINDQLSVRT